MKIRPEVQRFAELMEKVLRQNDYKGDGHKGLPLDTCMDRLSDEIRELERAAGQFYEDPNVPMGEEDRKKIITEAVDVANFCMMLIEGLPKETGKEA